MLKVVGLQRFIYQFCYRRFSVSALNWCIWSGSLLLLIYLCFHCVSEWKMSDACCCWYMIAWCVVLPSPLWSMPVFSEFGVQASCCRDFNYCTVRWWLMQKFQSFMAFEGWLLAARTLKGCCDLLQWYLPGSLLMCVWLYGRRQRCFTAFWGVPISDLRQQKYMLICVMLLLCSCSLLFFVIS